MVNKSKRDGTAKDPLRGGLIGCGFFAQNHLNGWQEVSGASIVSVCDLDESKTAQAVKQYPGIKSSYASAQEMLANENLDFVDIVTTMESHRELVECAAQCSVAAIVQKPFAPTMIDAAAMVDACEKAGVSLMVHENFRWQTPLKRVSEILSDGVIGTPFFARVSFRHGNPVGYENQPYLFEQDEYIINDVGIHLFDLARFYMGEVQSLYTQTQRVNQRFKGEDVATIMLRHVSDATSIVDLSVSTQGQPDPFPQTLVRIEATEGTVTLHQDFQITLEKRGMSEQLDASPVIYPWAEQPWAIVQESVVNIQQHWVDCLNSGTQPATSGADNLKSLALTFLAYQSAREKTALTV